MPNATSTSSERLNKYDISNNKLKNPKHETKDNLNKALQRVYKYILKAMTKPHRGFMGN